ncbi:hypothetical protein [Pseudochrobactrum kiredjianiae]|uniref:Scaffolding protein n=1 Tax=Pseudochrobactrum kiredjianiae TaxID=386305 RepID=A0ABW3V378_9HYPH|nr:hypothetical protein [Pseudochrobactrum kiredjianiae]MDM7852362.1 hypothetical protein [Pseudochrobactrum kiredjianiae]
MSDMEEGTLSAEAEAYFSSSGEVMPEDKPDTETAQPETSAVQEPQQPENPAVDGDSAEQDGDPNRTVPYGALHKERSKRKELEAKLQAEATEKAVLADRWNMLTQAMQQQNAPAVDDDPEPDPTVDIFAHTHWQSRQNKKMLDQLQERETQAAQQQQAQGQERAVADYWHHTSQEFSAQTPDYNDAIKYLSDTRDKQLQSMAAAYPQFQTQEGRNSQMNAELRDIVITAAKTGQSPAQVVYSMSKAYGFTGAAPAANAVVEQLQTIQDAQSRNKTVAQASGNPSGDALTAQAIADMSDRDFERWYSKPENQARFMKALGGR